MKTYLQDYLTILPQSDRQEVEKILTLNQELYEIQVINEEQFKELIGVLSKGIEQVTKLSKEDDKLEAKVFNQFFSGVSLDLENLYQRHLTTETVIANYDRILHGVLEDMRREVLKLQQRVAELDMRARGEEGLYIKSYGFEEERKSECMETDRIQYRHLFTDRDGTIVDDAVLERDYHQHYLALPKTQVVDALRDNGRITATVEVVERRGIPVTSSEHDLIQAIDGSLETYWAEVVVADSPIETKMTKLTNLEGGK